MCAQIYWSHSRPRFQLKKAQRQAYTGPVARLNEYVANSRVDRGFVGLVPRWQRSRAENSLLEKRK